MATQTLAQVRAAVKAAHPTATTAAINATARKDYAVDQQKAAAVATPTTAKAPTAAPVAITSAPSSANQQQAALTGAEYTYLVGGTGSAPDYTAQSAAWIAANKGSTTYLGQLYDRLNQYSSAYSSGYDTSPGLLAAAQQTAVAIYNA